ncbi:hypothetical protein EW146_g5116 [Bondarzewia mesenterica]|uniref:Uncharacterized protein n=1 Tax=Bondarzewia mesenterica TaxID=1095465 RepID=A0A4V3XEX7_9AGAM|nr:hypothetical protein EW146_g5116 [Bondarzewia mesenterica]
MFNNIKAILVGYALAAVVVAGIPTPVPVENAVVSYVYHLFIDSLVSQRTDSVSLRSHTDRARDTVVNKRTDMHNRDLLSHIKSGLENLGVKDSAQSLSDSLSPRSGVAVDRGLSGIIGSLGDVVGRVAI